VKGIHSNGKFFLKPSILTSEHKQVGYRTSRTCHLSNIDDPFVSSIDEKITRLMGLDNMRSDLLELQHYAQG
jgi:hypothetical protein